MANGQSAYVWARLLSICMSGIALIGAVLAVMILNVAPSALPVQLTGQLHLLYVLMTLFVGVLTFKILSQ